MDRIKIYTKKSNYSKMDYSNFNSKEFNDVVNKKKYTSFVRKEKERHITVSVKPDLKLFVDVNIPKFLYNTNTINLDDSDYHRFVEELHLYLAELGFKIWNKEFSSWYLSRVEFSCILEMSKPTWWYFGPLNNLWSPTRNFKTVYRGESVSFEMNKYKLIFYDKIREMLDRGKSHEKQNIWLTEKNLLRVELQLVSKKIIDRFIGSNKSLKDIFQRHFAIGEIINEFRKFLPEDFDSLISSYQDPLSLLQTSCDGKKRGSYENYMARKYIPQELQKYNYDVEKYRKYFLDMVYNPQISLKKAREIYLALWESLPEDNILFIHEILEKLLSLRDNDCIEKQVI